MSVDPEFENLVKLYYRDLYRFGFSLTRSEADACDLTQQTFYIWANKGHQLKRFGEGQRLALHYVASGVPPDVAPRQERFSDEPISEVAQNLPHVSADVVNRIDAQTMLGVLGQIDEDYRLRLCYITAKIYLTRIF